MYNAFREVCERVLRIPRDPRPPPGDDARTQIYRAAPNYYKYRLFGWAVTNVAHIGGIIVGVVILIFAATVTSEVSLLWLLLAVPLLLLAIFLAIFHLAVIRLDYEKRWYIVTDRSLRVREGVVGVREMTITFANIQNISMSQGPVQRLLGIADLRVDTAGGGGGSSSQQHYAGANLHTAWFRGIDNASEVRELIQQRLRRWKDAGLGDHDDAQPEASRIAGSSPDFLAALREVYAEAEALRRAAANSP